MTSLHMKLSAIIGFLVIALPELQLLLDADTATNPDYNMVIGAAIVAYGVFRGRQNNVSSQDVGIRPTS